MEETSDHGRRESVAPSASSPPENAIEGPSTSVPSSSGIHGENNDGDREESQDIIHTSNRQQRPHSSWASYRVNFSISNVAPSSMRDDVWSCLVVLVTFWLFASMTLILGFYGSENLQLGSSCSRLIQTNPLFVQSIQVEEIDELKPSPLLYGFYTTPPLDVEETWTEKHIASIRANFHKEWVHFLNQGSKVEISYSVKSTMPVSLVIARGRESLVEWIEDPSYPNTTLSWNIIYGSGKIQQEFNRASSYYIAVGNLNSEEVEIYLSFTIKAMLYNTSQAYYKCSLMDHLCSLKIFLFRRNVAVLTSPGSAEGSSSIEWYLKLSYGPRWITYFVGSGVMTVVILLAVKFCSMFQTSREEDDSGYQAANLESERAPLLSWKDDDLLSWGSSYDSVSQDEEDLEERFLVSSQEGNPSATEGEQNLNTRRLCVICFDAPRDCFFLPCGHCAACFACGSRIEEEAGCCPICRRKMKKVRKIFTV